MQLFEQTDEQPGSTDAIEVEGLKLCPPDFRVAEL